MLKTRLAAASHRDLFLQRYAWLWRVALDLAGHNADQAEDLLHDAFLHFTLSRPELDAIQNLEAYLCGMLRKLRLSQVRRSARHVPLAMIDYDSAEIALRAVDAEAVIQAKEALRIICRYACARRRTSKTGSILLLRFFLGYHTGEIGAIIRSSIVTVGQWLALARREFRPYLEDPTRLEALGPDDEVRSHDAEMRERSSDFLAEVRRRIVSTCDGACVSDAVLRSLYGHDSASSTVDCATLSHLVSCPSCLNRVNRRLGLPLLADRYPIDVIGRDDRWRGGGEGGSSAASIRRAGKTHDRHVQDIVDHRPKALRVVVNGFQVGSHDVGGEVSRLELRVHIDEPIGFIEVFSEQDLRLLFIDVQPPPDGAVEQGARVNLNVGRSLEVLLRFSDPWPTIEATYRDPLYHEWHAGEVASESLPSPSAADQGHVGQSRQEAIRPRIRASGFALSLHRVVAAMRGAIWMRQGLSTVVLTIALLAIWLLGQVRWSDVNAAELLRNARAAERSALARPNHVLHRIIDIERRQARDGALVERRRLECWRPTGAGASMPSVRRVYDNRQQLVAGEWTVADGSRTVYRRGAPAAVLRSSQTGGVGPFELGGVWRLEPSADQFLTLVGRFDEASAEKAGTTYIIRFEARASGDSGRLVRAALTLERPGLHGIHETVVLDEPDGLSEYRFSERRIEELPIDAVPASVFEPDAELTSAPSLALSGASTPTKAPPSVWTGAMSTAVAVDALYRLHQVDACLGQEATVSRSSSGDIQIRALVESVDRKRELVDALEPIVRMPHVVAHVRTVAETVGSHASVVPRSPLVEQLEITSEPIPVYADLKRYFSARQASDATDLIEADIHRYANGMLNRSRAALTHAWALKHLVEQFSPEAVASLPGRSRASWRAMVRDHARAFQQETGLLRLELQPIFFPTPPLDEGSAEDQGLPGAQDLRQLTRQARDLAAAHDNAIRVAFAISVEPHRIATIQTAEFWQSLKRAERLAHGIERAW